MTPGQSAVTVFPGLSPIPVSHQVDDDRPESILAGISDGMFVVGPDETEVVLVLTPETIGHVKAAGWSKKQMKELVFKEAHRPAAEWVRTGAVAAGSADGAAMRGAAKSPDGITLLVAGGQAGTVSHIIPLWGGGVDGQRKCPAKWPAKMSLVLLAMITDGSYSTRSRFMGGLRASMYFFAVSRWMPSSRATPRVDNPLRFAF